MIRRRHILIGGACAAAAATSLAMEPRRRISLLGRKKMAAIVPQAFGEWTSQDVSDLVKPLEQGSLTARLYGEEVARRYVNAAAQAEVAVLLAHGDSQTDQLQLHRPEVCYPAVGFAIISSAAAGISLPGGVTLPIRRLVARSPERREHIEYWTRLGEFFPVTGAQQRLDQLETALGGYVADGLLARFSVAGADAQSAFGVLQAFIAAMILATAAPDRPALIGTGFAQAMRPVQD
jgi:EpsI family protein